MASVRYIILSACQSAGLYTQTGWESEAAAWLEKQGSNPCAYVYYRQGVGVAGFDNVSVAFGGSNPSAALRRVRDSLERSLEFRSDRQTEVGGFPALAVTARAKRRIYGFGGGLRPVPPVPTTVDYMYFEAVEANSTVSLTSTLETAPNLEYSTDGETWQEWQHTTADGTHTFDTLTLTEVGDRVYLRGVNPAGFFDFENLKLSLFSMTGKIAAGGNVQSLVDGDTPTLAAKPMPSFSDFMMTEQPSDVLTQAPALPATKLAEYCYSGMFVGCTGLTQAPALPATKLAEYCYSGMFVGCTGLTQAPALPTTKLAEYCYSGMFNGCTGLTQAPALPATTLAEGCYSEMFVGCTGLMQAPALPATTLAEGCYSGMFVGCTGLTQAPALPATKLAEYCYVAMFVGCTGLTQAPALPATTLAEGCYSRMFNGCTGLTQAPALPATTLAEGCYSEMFVGCTGLTQAPALPATTLAEGCYSEMFVGCTGLTQAPALPATTLAESCYSRMFVGCTGLTQAPALPATTLAEGCYSEMFVGCTGLTQAPALPATTLAESCYSGMFVGCTFDMSDDGTTLNFDFPTPPITAGGTTYATAYDVAEWMGNTNGFSEH